RRKVAAFYRYGWWQAASRLQETIEYEWVSGSKLLVKNGMTGATGNIYCGLHEFADLAFLLHLLRPGDLFVDVGANIGSYTCRLSTSPGPADLCGQRRQFTQARATRNRGQFCTRNRLCTQIGSVSLFVFFFQVRASWQVNAAKSVLLI